MKKGFLSQLFGYDGYESAIIMKVAIASMLGSKGFAVGFYFGESNYRKIGISNIS